jgi:3-dehydroquinate synthase
MRGIRFVQVPTTLLAQVDSSVGGKTGINHPRGKNLIGAFHQPQRVLTDTGHAAHAAAARARAGLAEVLKHGLLADPATSTGCERPAARCSRATPALARAIARSCEIKAGVVARDERESGERALLNLGHTFGHAIEALTGYGAVAARRGGRLRHVLAADLSHRLGLIGRAPTLEPRWKAPCARPGCPRASPAWAPPRWRRCAATRRPRPARSASSCWSASAAPCSAPVPEEARSRETLAAGGYV